MSDRENGRLVILSGPSCVGKTPLFRSLGKFYPHLHARLHRLVLLNSRSPRPGELDGVDFHFRTRSQIEALKADNRYAVVKARSDLHALDLHELDSLLRRGDVIYEGNTHVAEALMTHPALRGFNRISIFISPLSKEEIAYLKAPERNLSLPDLVTDMMRRKLLRRTRRHKGELSAPDLENIETRASSAYRELQSACSFQYVIPNHDGEDSDHWDAFYYLIGDAGKTLDTFAALLEGTVPPLVEKWEADLIP
jgi:guanylate kinase